MKKNSWIVMASVAALIYMLMPVADGLAQDRLDLEPGETNWTETVFPKGTTAVITTTDLNAITVLQMVETLTNTTFPDPVLAVQNLVWTGDNRAGGIFAGAMMPIGLDHGAILSSGNIASVIGGGAFPWNTAQNISTCWGLPGDPVITANCGFPTFDAAKLTFEIKSDTAQVMVFYYVFGSEEYREWCGTQYSDGFKILVDGINVALIPPILGAPPVCITPTCPPNPWYLDNTLSNRETELDGMTQGPGAPLAGPGIPVTSLAFLMTADVWHTVEIIIADSGDCVWDSNAFVKTFFDPDTLLGACALPGGDCVVTTEGLCTAAGGLYQGPGSTCPDTTGACCASEGCFELTEAFCDSIEGFYEGDFTTCSPVGACVVGDDCYVTSESCCPGEWQGAGTACPASGHVIPTLNQWGILVLLVLLAACAIIIVRRRQATAH